MSEISNKIYNAVVAKVNPLMRKRANAFLTSFKAEWAASCYEHAINMSRHIPDTDLPDPTSHIYMQKTVGEHGLENYTIGCQPQYTASLDDEQLGKLKSIIYTALHRALGRVEYS